MRYCTYYVFTYIFICNILPYFEYIWVLNEYQNLEYNSVSCISLLGTVFSLYKVWCLHTYMKVYMILMWNWGGIWRHFDKLLSELFLELSPDRNMISDFGFQEHIELLKLDVLLGTDFCQTRTTLRHFVAKNNYGSSYYSCGIQYCTYYVFTYVFICNILPYYKYIW